MSLALGGLLEDDDVLPGEELERFLEGEALGLELAADLGEGHLVLGLDRDLGVLAAELDEHEPAAGLERLAQALQGGLGVGAFVVDVDHQDQVDLALGELGVGGRAADRLDVLDPGVAGVVGEHPEHLGLDVGGVDRAASARPAAPA